MPKNAFDAELGTRQGRLTSPVGTIAPEGSAVFVLGYDLPGHTELLEVGDYVEVSQTGELSGASTKLLRVTATLRGPAEAPPGARWRLSFRINGTAVTSRLLVPARTVTTQLTANVAKLGLGTNTFALRLALEAA